MHTVYPVYPVMLFIGHKSSGRLYLYEYKGGATNLKVGGVKGVNALKGGWVNIVKTLQFENVGCMTPQFLLWRRPCVCSRYSYVYLGVLGTHLSLSTCLIRRTTMPPNICDYDRVPYIQ